MSADMSLDETAVFIVYQIKQFTFGFESLVAIGPRPGSSLWVQWFGLHLHCSKGLGNQAFLLRGLWGSSGRNATQLGHPVLQLQVAIFDQSTPGVAYTS